jgi:hypothetical protein
MTARRSARAPALVGACVVALGAAAARAADFRAADPRAADPNEREAAARAAGRVYPLVLWVQGDAVLSSTGARTGDAAGAATNDPPVESGVRVRRLRVGEDVGNGRWRARFVFESQPGQPWLPIEGGRLLAGTPARLTDAFVAWTPHRAFQLVVGAQRVPFSLSRQVNEEDLRLPERAPIVTTVAPDFRVGVSLTTDLGLMRLQGAFLSADPGLDERLATSGFFGALRLSADPVGPMGVAPWRRRANDPWYGWWRFSAGVSLLYGTLLGPRNLGAGADGQFQWRRFTATGEVLFLRGGAGHDRRTGAVVEPGVFVWPERIELVLRAAWYRRAPGPTPAPGGAPAAEASDTFAAGAGLTFISRDGKARLQAALERRHAPDAPALRDTNWAIIRATLAI